MKIHPFKASYPEQSLIPGIDSFLSKVKENYREFADNGFFNKDNTPSIFIYQIEGPIGKKHTGIIASAELEDYLSGKIVIHEHTIADKEQQQMELIVHRHSMVKPILLCFDPVDNFYQKMEKWVDVSELFFSVELEDSTKHLFYKIGESSSIQEIQQYFENSISHAYIADGHHRTAAASRLYKNYSKAPDINPEIPSILSVFFPYDQLEVHDYNRVIEVLNSITPTLFLAKLSKYCNISPLDVPAKPGKQWELTCFINREWYRLNWRHSAVLNKLKTEVENDYQLFNELILKEILGIEDVRSDRRIKYVAGPDGIQGVIDATQKNDLNVGFCLYPLSLNTMIKVADQKATLPPKSTYFLPRIKNGLIVQEI
ncbi:MAG: DUF1015 domain-containing protein [Saprospirales bacterium]|nr:MAG: DUF1015 domain-containing protein [Saprospirales bacterium]